MKKHTCRLNLSILLAQKASVGKDVGPAVGNSDGKFVGFEEDGECVGEFEG